MQIPKTNFTRFPTILREEQPKAECVLSFYNGSRAEERASACAGRAEARPSVYRIVNAD
jgi:hypothetical protein